MAKSKKDAIVRFLKGKAVYAKLVLISMISISIGRSRGGFNHKYRRWSPQHYCGSAKKSMRPRPSAAGRRLKEKKAVVRLYVYRNSHDAVMSRWNDVMLQVVRVPGVFSSALGDIGYIFRSPDTERIEEVVRFIHAVQWRRRAEGRNAH